MLGNGGRSCRAADSFMDGPVALLAVSVAVPHRVACRAATGSYLIAAVVGTLVFPSHWENIAPRSEKE